jgi:hypothetical protein
VQVPNNPSLTNATLLATFDTGPLAGVLKFEQEIVLEP